MINEYLAKKDISMYQLSKICGVPYNTLKDVSSGKTDIRKCSGETIHRISQALGVSMDTLFAAYYQTTSDFERVCRENGYPEFFEFDDIRLKRRQAVESMEKQDGEHFLL